MRPTHRYNHRLPPRLSWPWQSLLSVVLLVLAACAPGGPMSSELAATEAFATLMPGSVEVGTGGDDPRWTVEGSDNGFAWRMSVAETDEAAVVA